MQKQYFTVIISTSRSWLRILKAKYTYLINTLISAWFSISTSKGSTGKDATSKAISVEFNTRAFHVIRKELAALNEGLILQLQTNLECTKIAHAHESAMSYYFIYILPNKKEWTSITRKVKTPVSETLAVKRRSVMTRAYWNTLQLNAGILKYKLGYWDPKPFTIKFESNLTLNCAYLNGSEWNRLYASS